MPLLALLLACSVITEAEKRLHDDPDGDGDPVDKDCDDFDPEVSSDASVTPEVYYNGKDDDCDSATADGDADGDGHDGVEGGGEDCDDEDAAIHPGATELCDDLDNDCDGEVDEEGGEGQQLWYADEDGDQHGDPGSERLSCAQLDDYVSAGDDCDDGDAGVFPGAYELCDAVDNDCDDEIDEEALDQSAWYPDVDGDDYGEEVGPTLSCTAPDGFVGQEGDCDDGDAQIHPEASEHCDEVDEDCDGETDESAADAGIWFVDVDGDAYGDAGTSIAACAAPDGYVSDPTDCDDVQNTIHPGAEESCDDVDNDCDGEVDESSASDAESWYLDADGDGYGDLTVSTLACDAPAGYVDVEVATDCDDDLIDGSTIHPGAVERVGDGVDSNCDGKESCYTDEDEDGEASVDGGSLDSGDADCLDPGEASEEGEDCADGDPTVFSGAPRVCDDGRANDCTSTDAEEHELCRLDLPETTAGAFWTISEADEEAGVGEALAAISDLDGDGVDELLIGASQAEDGGSELGKVWLVLGGLSPRSEHYALSDESAVTFVGVGAGDLLGRAVAVGPLDDDEIPDVLIGAPKERDGDGDTTGAVWLVAGEGLLEDPKGAPLARMYGATNDYAGTSLSAHQEEGWALVGLPDADASGANNAGEARTVRLAAEGDALETVSVLASSTRYAYAGEVVMLGDLDGDGSSEAILGAPGNTSVTSRVFAVDDPGEDMSPLESDAEWIWSSTTTGEEAGSTLGICDLDDDGRQDLLIGAPVAVSSTGRLYLDLDLSAGASSLDDLDAREGEATGDRFGAAVACSDLDGDGFDDLVVGASREDVGFDEDAGAFTLSYGPLTALGEPDLEVTGEHGDQKLGSALAIVGDQSGDGHDDLLAGSEAAATDLSGEVIFGVGAASLFAVPNE